MPPHTHTRNHGSIGNHSSAIYFGGKAWFKTFTVHSKVGKIAAFTGTARITVVPTPRKKRRTPGMPPPADRYTCRKHAAMLCVVGSRGSTAACFDFRRSANPGVGLGSVWYGGGGVEAEKGQV